ncbi:hypothetical protein GGR51DRAFT_524915 [Nemania sp. FL0031]|nr:hypothetical protein GGR51DRAFT_524915 [Nemania sp. FL0031]
MQSSSIPKMVSRNTAFEVNPTIIDVRHSDLERMIYEQVISGLTGEPKTLPGLLFWNIKGLQHWNAHSCQPEYYPRHEEVRILNQKANAMASTIVDDSVVVDMGSASCDKVIHLLRALESQKKDVTYYALDLSAVELKSTLQAIPKGEFQHVRFAALHGTFEDALKWLRETPGIRDRPHCMLLFGITIGSYSRESAAAFLRQIAEQALAGNAASSILLTIDSCRLPTKILRAYTSEGVTPFALEALRYANHLLGQANAEGPQLQPQIAHDRQQLFNPEDWYFHSQWNYVLGRHEASLIPRSNDVKLGAAMDGAAVKREEKVMFGCSYKYNKHEREQLFRGAGLRNTQAWELEGCDVAFYELKLGEA